MHVRPLEASETTCYRENSSLTVLIRVGRLLLARLALCTARTCKETYVRCAHGSPVDGGECRRLPAPPNQRHLQDDGAEGVASHSACPPRGSSAVPATRSRRVARAARRLQSRTATRRTTEIEEGDSCDSF